MQLEVMRIGQLRLSSLEAGKVEKIRSDQVVKKWLKSMAQVSISFYGVISNLKIWNTLNQLSFNFYLLLREVHLILLL